MQASETDFITRGDFSPLDLKEIQSKLAPSKKVRFVACVSTRNDTAKYITILTNESLILIRKGDFRFFGEREGIQDIPYSLIRRVHIEQRKKYDLLIIHLKDGKEKFMTPKDTGAEIISKLRHLQTVIKRKEKRGETPLKKLERLSELKEKDVISEEKFEEKKDELLEDI